MEHVLPSRVKVTETQLRNADDLWYGRSFDVDAPYSQSLCVEVDEFLDGLLGDDWREKTTILNQVNVVYQTQAQAIAILKSQWLFDPQWDIETTEGFEAHHDELLDWRLSIEANRATAVRVGLEIKARELGVPGNIQLATYIERLENQIKALTARLDDIEDERNLDASVKLWSGK